MKKLLPFLLLCACGGASHNSPPTTPVDDTPAIQSNDILAREIVTTHAIVKHVLIAWKDLETNYAGSIDKRALARTRAEADELAQKTLARVRAGEDIEPLMKELSDDKGTAANGKAYDVTVDAKLIFEFKRLSLRLNVGETGLVKTPFGWHIIKRLE